VGAEIFTNFWCFVHNFGYRYARKSFKCSKDADFGLVSEKFLSHNNGPIGWGPGPGNIAKNTPTCGVPPRKPPPKTKKFFFHFEYKTCWIRRGFEQLSSSIAWWVVGLQSSAWNVVFAGQWCCVYISTYTIFRVTFYGNKSFSSKYLDTKMLQSIYFAYKVGIISFYSNRISCHVIEEIFETIGFKKHFFRSVASD